MAMAKKTKATELVIPKQKILQFPVYIGGDISVVHQFSEKARGEIRDKQGHKAKGPKGARDPRSEYLCSKYIDAKTLYEGMPCAAVRRAIIDAASFVEGITKVQLRGAVFVLADGQNLDRLGIFHVRTTSGKPIFREDVVRLPTGGADLRYRSSFEQWGAKLTMQIDPDVFSPEQVHHLIERAGFSIGLCESRPQKSGEWGQFKIISEKEFSKMKPVRVSQKDFEVVRAQMAQRNFGEGEDNVVEAPAKRRRKAA